MKEVVEIVVNNGNTDCIVEYYQKTMNDPNGRVLFANTENTHVKAKGEVYEILLYVDDPISVNRSVRIKLTAHGIKTLYAIIHEIESKVSEELYEGD